MSDEIDITLTCCNRTCDSEAMWCITSLHDRVLGPFNRYACSQHIVEHLARSVPNEIKYLGPTYGDRDGNTYNIRYDYDKRLINGTW